MPNWFLGKIRYQQPIDDSTVGTRNQEFVKQKIVTEEYLVDAVSYTDAETRLYQEIAANTPDFEITNITRMKLADIFSYDDGSETWFKVKAMFITDDEKTGKQKKTPSVMLVNAETPKQAYERIEEQLKTALDPFEITDVNTTKILEIFPYDEEESQNLRPIAEFIEGSVVSSDNEQPQELLTGSVAQKIVKTLDLKADEMALILSIPAQSYNRLKSKSILGSVASRRLTLLSELATFGLEVFEDQHSFNLWLRLPLQELSDRSPVSALEKYDGFTQVNDILSRIEHGVYS